MTSKVTLVPEDKSQRDPSKIWWQ